MHVCVQTVSFGRIHPAEVTTAASRLISSFVGEEGGEMLDAVDEEGEEGMDEDEEGDEEQEGEGQE